jgi:SAM-dependent methyltransferase
LLYLVILLLVLLSSVAAFFFVITRGTLLMRAARGSALGDADHVYPVYSNRWLIRLIDYQPIISAILLGQYGRLVSAITHRLGETDLRARDVLITSCAFGYVMPRVVASSVQAGARRVVIADIIRNELDHAERKLRGLPGERAFLEENATALSLPTGSVSANVIFFLLHELPHPFKAQVLNEAIRVLAPGGKLYLAEFHRPDLAVFRVLSWTYFTVFEPLALALWDSHDPVRQLESLGEVSCERHTVFFGNFQLVVATKRH